MTGVLDTTAADTADTMTTTHATARSRGSAWARWRVAARLARRQVRRSSGSSALVVALVALPVAALTGGAVVWQSHEPSAEQRAALELGRNAAWIEAVDSANPTRWQAVDVPWNNDVERTADGTPTVEGDPVPADPTGVLPAGTDLFSVTMGSTGVETAGGVGWLTAVAGDVWDPAFSGKYVLIDGVAPTAPDEMMATPGALQRIGSRIGERVLFVDQGRAMTVTGTIRQTQEEASFEVLYVPETAASLVDDGYVRWYAPTWQPDLDGLGDMNRAGFIVYGHDLAVDPPPGARVSEYGSGRLALWNVLLVGGIIAAFSGYVVVLLAGAAFSVAARRQQRALAMAASVGAARGDVFRMVLLQGTVLGAVGAAVGLGLGTACAAFLLIATDRGAPGTFWGNFGFQIPWPLVAGIAGFAIVVGTLAALIPARRATHGDILGALRGARRPAALGPRRPLAGLIVLTVGLAATAVGALVMGAQIAAPPEDGFDAVFYGAVWAVVLGPFVFQIGLLIPSHWVLVQLSRPLGRLGLAPRLATRDAAATPSRVVPAFAVIGACVFAASVAVSATALTAAGNARHHYYSAPLGALTVSLWQQGDDATDELLAAAAGLVDPTAPTDKALVSSQTMPAVDRDGTVEDPELHQFGAARQGYTDCVGSACLQPFDAASGTLYVVSPDDVAMLLGVDPGQTALRAMASGAALVTEPDYVTDAGRLVVTEWDAQAYLDLMADNDPMAYNRRAPTAPEPFAEHALRAVGVDIGHDQPFQILIAPETAARLGVPVTPTQLVATYDTPLDQATIDELTALTRDLRVGPTAGVSAWVERGPTPVDPWLWLMVGIAVALVTGASAVALGLARFERRPDDATLAALGGGPLLRRNINAWQATVITAIGTVVGTAAGYVSMWGFATANSSFFDVADTPWLALGVLAIGLPAAIVAVAWLVPPRRPDLTRRTAIT